MKAKITAYLNERVQSPNLDADNPVYYKPGDTVEIVDIVNGEEFEGNRVWYKLDNGAYIWSGGVEGNKEIDEDLPTISENSSIKVDTLRDIYSSYPGRGADVGIGILDSGVNDNHPYLKKSIKYYESFITDKSKRGIHSHGNRVAGVICSHSDELNRNISDLFVFRVSSGNNVQDSAVLSALTEIEKNENLFSSIDVINMSIDISSNSNSKQYYLPKIQSKIDSLLNKGIVSVISAGEDGYQNTISHLTNCIHVGCSKSFKPKNRMGYDIFFLNQKISTYSLNSADLNSSIDGDSAYTAYTTGILTRHIEINQLPKDSSRLDELCRYLNGICLDSKNEVLIPLTPYNK